LVSWEPTYECNATFFELFESGPAGLKILPLILEPGEAGRHAVRTMSNTEGLSYRFIRRESDGIDFIVGADLISAEISVIHTDYDGVLVMEDVNCQDYMITRSKFYKALVPVSNVRGVVSEVINNYFDDRYLYFKYE
jgi:hypothetical protein